MGLLTVILLTWVALTPVCASAIGLALRSGAAEPVAPPGHEAETVGQMSVETREPIGAGSR